MLNLNSPVPADNESPGIAATDPVWKVLIYDQLGQDIISPLIKVSDLRENGVTVHMPLFSDRQPIPDVPAIYFLQPTEENVRRLGEDFAKHLYEYYYINFSSSLPRPLLEELAQAAVNANVAPQISQVYDQYLNYVCLESNLFTLNMGESYRLLNDPTTSDSQIERMVDTISSSLFSVLVTRDVIPIIRCQRGTAAEMVAAKLDSRLRDHALNSRSHVSLDSGSSQLSNLTRPVLILLDRNMDMSTMLTHTWTYAPLLHDLLDMKLNRIVLTTASMGPTGKTLQKKVDIDVGDFFWAKHAANPFPTVAEDVDVEINKYKKDVEELTHGNGTLEDIDPNNLGATQDLKAAISALPKLTERKRILDLHTEVATALFKLIEQRQLDVFFSMEEYIGKQASYECPTKTTILDTIKDLNKSAEDKLRLFLIYYLYVDDISKEDMAEFEQALQGAGCGLDAVQYVKKVRSFNKMTAASSSVATPSTSSDIFGKITSIGQRVIKDAGVGGGLENLLSGVKSLPNLLPSRKNIPAIRIVDGLMEGTGPEHDEYLYFDPKAGRGAGGGRPPKSTVGFQEAVVFVIGGGNYLEYGSLLEYSQVSPAHKCPRGIEGCAYRRVRISCQREWWGGWLQWMRFASRWQSVLLSVLLSP
ncbi:Sec1-like protein [Polychytrium aggregatum]|uniref:Sec1-like protein n=1 Tax=Polychytrium aggregatum TaxID=110093 RepID=UPI0022FF1D99|nr:Sec1-like protein [Polychytrium aggregatum]KAI9204158.1 Sec1-like protein [Polychytrium aggregatum]